MMVEDTERLQGTIEQVLRAGRLGAKIRHTSRVPVDLAAVVQDCVALARTRHHLPEDALVYRESLPAGSAPRVLGDEDELKAVVSNLVDNAVKYSGSQVQVAVELEQPEPARRRRCASAIGASASRRSSSSASSSASTAFPARSPSASRAPGSDCSSCDR